MTKRLKIIRLQSRICIGGPAIHMEMLAKHLPHEKYETILVGGKVADDEKDVSAALQQKEISVVLLDSMKREVGIWDDFKSVFQFYRLLRIERPEIVCTHTAKAGAIGRIAAFMARTPVVVHTFHGHVFNNYFGKFKTRIFIYIERILARISDQIITISPAQYDDITETYRIAPRRKVSMVRLGLELEPLKTLNHNDNLKKDLNIPPGVILLGFIGRLVPIKNMGMAIRTLELLMQESPDYHLCIAGDGEEKRQWQVYCKERAIDSNVHFMGWIADIKYVLAGIDILILTSRNEGTPIAVIEAMASQIPVVATAVGGVPDLIHHDHTGYLVSIDDVSGMVHFIKQITKQPERTENIKREAAASVINQYDYRRMVREIDQIYTRLFNEASHQ